jgi:uncharacterized protein DUF222
MTMVVDFDLSSADELRFDDLCTLNDAALTERLQSLDRLADRVEAARLAALGEWDARAVWALDGAYGAAGWMAAREPMGRAQAGGLVRTATKLRSMPATSSALAAETVSTAKARVLSQAVNPRTREAFARDEAMLLEQAKTLTVDETAWLVRHWLAQADPDGAGPRDKTADNAHLSQTIGGRWRLDGDLSDDGGAILSDAINRVVEEMRHGRIGSLEEMTPAQMRAAALVEIARRSTAAGANGPGSRPLIWVITPADGTIPAVIPGVGPISAGTAERLGCDATHCRILVDQVGRIVDIGRASRDVTPTQRRLLWIRDGGCTFPGCDRPPHWCEAHHLAFWEHGGRTDLVNLALLCSHHHHLCHEGGYLVWRDEGGALVFARPDGSIVVAPAPAA